MAVTIFFWANVVSAISCALLAVFFVRRVKLPREHRLRNCWRTLVALIFAALFFIGCAHTHVDLAFQAASGMLGSHWFETETIISHVMQAAGGIGFYLFATFWTKLSIFDKKDYEHTIKEIDNEIAKKNDL